ncbi:hypothetical protein P8C59_007235 [Phyllachora maydis]|uniref:Uncharacterized protein n=1 Tax=Phyllachora maydis TaxID=1825666 RepID=A0AAD9I955_9PEZI|nr:hypothetical protein P8C59_007235 [Phyllachora maydis]
MQWPMKETEIAALVTKINKLGAGTTLPQGLPVDGAERFIQLAADLRAELNAKVEQLNKGLQATMDLCKGLVKDLGEQVKDLARRTDANTAASEACRTEMHSWQARIEKVQEVEEELRDSMDVCRLSVASLESQFSNLSTKELAVLILRQLEQLHPNSVRLDADNQWLRDKIDSLENDFQGVKRKLEEGSYVPNPNTGNHDIASCLDYARDMARSIKRRRLSDA